MKRQLYVLLLIGSLGLGVYAQKADVTETNLRASIDYLASDKLEGRRTGEPGASLAATFIADRFAKYGLVPVVENGRSKPGYKQTFPYITGVERAKTGNKFDLTISDTTNGPLAQVSPVGCSPNGVVTNAPISFAGYGIVSKEANFDDYSWHGRQMDFKGDVVVVFDGNPDNDNPHSPYTRFDLRTKALIAKEHGAVGMLVISRESLFQHDRLTRMEYDQSLGEAAIPTFVISRETARQILGYPNEASLKTAEELSADKSEGANTNIGFRDVQPHVTFGVNLVKKSVDAFNVVGMLRGTDPLLKNEAIVIGAHYDHLGHGGAGSLAVNSTEIHHGADDNASGTAAIIELARMFAANHDNKRTLVFVAFSGEEEGLFGSNWYVNHPVFPLDKTVAMINLDMVGRLKDDKLTIGGMGTASEWKELVTKMNGTNGDLTATMTGADLLLKGVIEENIKRHQVVSPVVVSVHDGDVVLRGRVLKTELPGVMMAASESNPKRIKNLLVFDWRNDIYSEGPFSLQLSEDGFGPSDHSSFYGKKIPVLFFFTGTHDDYHKPTDTADKINYVGEHAIVNYIQAIVTSIDRNSLRPTYTVAKSSGSGRMGFNVSLGTVPNYADSDNGLLLDGVRDGSPAAKAGVKAGDRVVKLAGHDVRNVMDYTYVLGEMKPDQEYEIVVVRGTGTLTMKITPVRRQ